MSEMSEKYRAAAKDKAARLARSDPHARVDASGYSPEGALDGNVQTGPRVLSRRQFRRGGTVEGKAPTPRADRRGRASGGRSALTADSYQNRNLKEANEDRVGTKHIGGFAKGGLADLRDDIHRENQTLIKKGYAPYPAAHLYERPSAPEMSRRGTPLTAEEIRAGARGNGQARVHKLIGGALTPAQKLAMTGRQRIGRAEGGKVHEDEAQDRRLIHREVHAMGCKCARCSGGKVTRAEGGRAEEESGHWIAGAVKHPGSLRKALHVKAGHDIPEKKLEKAEHSKNPKLARKAHLAETLNGLHKKSGGSVRGPAINDGTRPTGGRLARKGGGRAKKPMNVNIIIAPQGSGATQRGMPMAPPMAAAGPVGLHQGAPPAMAAPMPPASSTGMPMRARGGRTYPIRAGAGSGLGRIEKARAAKA